MNGPDLSVAPVKVQCHVFRYKASIPVVASFGSMTERPALLVRVEDATGAYGWGEAWCNFPQPGAEYRRQLIESILGPLLIREEYATPREAFERLCRATSILALQSGELGPFAHAIAGIDLALWDLVARRTGEPLWRLLGGKSDSIGVYASGLNPVGAREVIMRKREQGYQSFKLKIGFGVQQDLANLNEVCDAAGDAATLMVDANQGWSLPQASEMVEHLNAFDLAWIEEPLRADRPWDEWITLKSRSRAPLAAGENIAGQASFATLLACKAVDVVQPDAAKWGGVSGCSELIPQILDAGLRYCPHYLGGGIGLLHSAHLLAASGSAGLLEVDANENPLRELLCGPINEVMNGRIRLGENPGIGIEPNLDQLTAFSAT